MKCYVIGYFYGKRVLHAYMKNVDKEISLHPTALHTDKSSASLAWTATQLLMFSV